MEIAAAIDALRPLITQYQAVAKLDGVLKAVHSAAADASVLEERLTTLRAEVAAMEAQTQADRRAHDKRRADAKAKADAAEADLQRIMDGKAAAEQRHAVLLDQQEQQEQALATLLDRVQQAEAQAAAAEAEAAARVAAARERAKKADAIAAALEA